MTSSNIGKWSAWYDTLTDPQPYADTATYQLGAEWLAGCATVEDWGCGMGWMRRFVPPERYCGVDGTASPFADEVVDLATYQSTTDGLFMRHVLEHNRDWRSVLDNAVASYRERMVLVLFTPMAEATQEIAPFDNVIDVPNIAFRHDDLAERFGDASFSFTDLPSGSFYGTERIYYLERSRG